MVGCVVVWMRSLARVLWLLAFVTIVAACRGPAVAPTMLPTEPSAVVAEGETLETRAKIFLVAGGHDSANFAQEIIDQRRIWREAGFADDEIACYWARPTRRSLAADGEQYRRLLEELRSCHAASPALLRRHLEIVASRQRMTGELPFVYLYITSHGSRSILADGQSSKQDRVRRATATASPCEQQLLDQHAMVLAGDRAGALHVPSILQALRAGAQPHDVMLTPASLRDALLAFGDVPKIVVLQGCYTGGFIGAHGDARDADGLAGVPNLTLLTAARHDRASFGCQPGTDRTEFGRAFNDVLATTRGLAQPTRVPWRRVHARTRAVVESREAQLYGGRSEPRFFRSGRHARSRERSSSVEASCAGVAP